MHASKLTERNDLDLIGPNSMSLWYSDANNFRGFLDFFESVTSIFIGMALKVAKLTQPQLAPFATVANIVSKAPCKAMLSSAKTDRLKQQILHMEDENYITLIRINDDGTINIISPSGRPATAYYTKTQTLGL